MKAAGLVMTLAAFGAAPALLGDGPFLYVTNERSGTVTVIDGSTDRTVATIPVGSRPRGVQASPGGRRIYVAVSDRADKSKETIAVIDTVSNEVVQRFASGIDPEQFAVSPDGKTAVIANEDAAQASFLNLSSGKIEASRPVGTEPEGVGITPDGRFAWVTGETSNTVTVFEMKSRRAVRTIPTDQRPRVVVFSSDGKRAYVSCEVAATLLVLDAASGSRLARVAFEGAEKPEGIAFAPDRKSYWVATSHGHSVAIVNAETNAIQARVPVGQRPWGVAMTAGGKLYTANGKSNDVSVVDTKTRRVIATIPAGDGPWGVAVASRPR
jgi:PQQ-dependent catabolism-associated beta-propeller protein